ncbi:SpoIVB peptidase [Gracilibacillus caseinilyticus]|uniref:SpoIVB peptidase n=1 Tax=Gracilibacillus caseinilyticus TaxID=2932256 RepID=A0ABY4ESU6_9BACI|nr:SpoIVB peptidase [Gracilibacillus caseinilyticus]UOQ47496.1 SpoIVB peptidase [Gracilibacillus caseinilyticus]
MKNNYVRKCIGLILLVILFVLPWYSPFQIYLSIPNQIKTFTQSNAVSLPTLGDDISISAMNDDAVQYATDLMNYSLEESGQDEVTYTFANVPVKKVDVEVYDDFRLIPGGQSIGINLQTQGVLVVGHHLVTTEEGTSSPGEDANIQVGDNIISINDKKITKMQEVAPIVKKAGEQHESLDVELKRGGKTIDTELTPQYDVKEEDYRIGVYIRDSAAGIGTMTFYHSDSKKYGALGHIISDMDTREPVKIDNGSIVRSQITDIKKGEHGVPGEKRADFVLDGTEMGDITKNSPFGIFGTLHEPLKGDNWAKPMPIALPNEVEEGPAKILTVINKEKVEAFDVEIVNAVNQSAPATKGLILEITDKRLLDTTGGIVQGMSGSPIIQNGKIIGAVTHVFVNDPTSGYGVHIEWMLNEAGIDIYKSENRKAS